MSLMDANRAKDTLLDAIAGGSTVKEAAASAGVSAGTHYQWLKSDPAYQEAFKYARSIRADLLEEEAERRAIHGYDEVTTFTDVDGRESYKRVHKFSDPLLQMLLRADKPEKFTDRVKQEISGEVTVADTLAAARKRLQAARSEENGE